MLFYVKLQTAAVCKGLVALIALIRLLADVDALCAVRLPVCAKLL